MRGLVVGASGLVGRAIHAALGDLSVGTYLTRERRGLVKLDARDRAAFRQVLRDSRAEVIYLPAAQPNVEWCELNPSEAYALNVEPTQAAIEVADGRQIVAYSTDYVFDGANGPYVETDPTAPLNVYGRIKLEIEELLSAHGHATIRTTGVFGFEEGEPKNFVLRLLASLKSGHSVRVPTDQVANPTYAPDLAKASIRIAEARKEGVWHFAGLDLLPRSEFARRVAKAFDLSDLLLIPVPTTELGQVAKRPLLSGLLCPRYEAAFGASARGVDAALAELKSCLTPLSRK